MRLGRPCFYGLSAAFVLLFAPEVGAQSASTEKAVLWYRSSEGCPDGAHFLGLLGDRAAEVRLAEAGDRVDFVVNLALGPEGAKGRLERETARGTVAIREVGDESCEKVAQVVALNLSLALEPGLPTPDTEKTEAPSEEEPLPETKTAPEAEPPPKTDTPPPSPNAEKPRAAEKTLALEAHAPIHTEESEPERGDTTEWRVGLVGGLQSGLGAGFMGRGALFLEARSLISSLPHLTVRGAGLAAFGSTETDIGTIRQTLWAGHLRVCPVAWSRGTITLDPCVTFDLGQLAAAGPLRASALWAALGAHAQARWALWRLFSLDGDFGADFPLRSYEIAAGSTTLYRTAPASLSVLVGASVAF